MNVLDGPYGSTDVLDHAMQNSLTFDSNIVFHGKETYLLKGGGLWSVTKL